jgi:transposase-like protein
MSLKKLSEADKNEILTLYRESEETTSTLAERFEVSSSTISRFLKGSLTLEEYEELIQKKRLARTPYRRQPTHIGSEYSSPEEEQTLETDKITLQPETSLLEEQILPSFSCQLNEPEDQLLAMTNPYSIQQLDLFNLDSEDDEENAEQVEVLTLQQLLGEDIGDLDEDGDYEEDEEDDINFEELSISSLSHPVNVSLEILPLSQAKFPKICYLVIDRRSELITRPLKDFRELGKIPLTEIQEQTLPIFDNHRIARRFSNRRERVIKVPDSSVFIKTCSYLQAKGITRILLDGQVYSLN